MHICRYAAGRDVSRDTEWCSMFYPLSPEDARSRAQELTHYVPAPELFELLQTFADATGLAAGIVDLAGEPVTRIANECQFCHYVRRTHEGREGCRKSDLKCVGTAERRDDAVRYRCHAGLSDCIAILRICGRPVGLVHMGQARPFRKVNEQKLRALYDRLKARSKRVSFKKFVEAYAEMPVKSAAELDSACRLLGALAVQISRRASEQAALEVVQHIGAMTSSILDLDAGLNLIFEKAKSVVPFDTGSISLWDEERECLVPEVLSWGGARANARSMKMTFAPGEGLIGQIGKRKSPILLATTDAVDRIPPKSLEGCCSRRLRCFLGVPVLLRGQLIGVLEVGARRENAFAPSDIALLELMASQVAAFVKMVRERDYFIDLVSEVDLDRLLGKVVVSAPQMVRGKGCSIFLKDRESGRFVLAATTGLWGRAGRIARTGVWYKPGEGMTGWVAKTGRTLRVSRRDYESLREIDRGLRWERKFNEHPRAVGRNRPFLATALKRNGQILGVIRISDCYGDDFSEEDQAIMEATATHIVSAMERAGRLRSRVVDTLQRTAQILGGQFDLDATLQRIVESAVELVPTASCSLYLVGPDDKLRIRAAKGSAKILLGKAVYDLGEGITGWIAHSRQRVRARTYRELRSHPAWKGKYVRLQWGRRLVQSYLGIPLVARNQVVGVLKMAQRGETPGQAETCFTDEDERILEILGAVASLAIDNARLFGEEFRKTVDALHAMAEAIMGKGELEEVLVSLVDSVARIFDAEECSLYLLDSSTGLLTMRAGHGHCKALVGEATYRIGEGVTGWIAKTGQSFSAASAEQLRAHPAWKGKYDPRQWPKPKECRSFLGVPLRVGGQTVGVLKVQNKRPQPYFGPNEKRILSALAGVAAVLIEDVRLTADILRKREEALREAVDKVAADTAHEIGTALHPATTLLNVVRDQVRKLPRKLRGDLPADIAGIEESCVTATQALRKIKEYSVPLRLRRRRVSLSDLVRKCLRDMLGKDGPFIVYDGKSKWFTKADREQVAHLFRELVHNSRKVKPAKLRVRVRIRPCKRNRPQFVEIVYRDNGPGVPDEYKERIFERHFALGLKKQGTGLGLSLARKIVEAHGGEIAEVGREGAGAAFRILLPQ